MAIGLWGAAFGPLNLAEPLHALPQGSRKNFPKFYGDGKQHPNEHIKTLYIAVGVFGVEHEDISIRLFIETSQSIAADWFYNLEPNSIIDWASLHAKFLKRFKPTEDEHALLA